MIDKVSDALCLDSAATDGLTTEVSQPRPMNGLNAIQVQVVLYALTATNLTIQVQVSNDGHNWQNQGLAQTMTAFGRKIFSAEAAIGASLVRLHYSLTGSGKAILDAYMVTSDQ